VVDGAKSNTKIARDLELTKVTISARSKTRAQAGARNRTNARNDCPNAGFI